MGIFLETTRLMLKTPELSDFDNLLILRSDPDVMKYIGDGTTHTEAQVRKFLQEAIQYEKKYGIGFYKRQKYNLRALLNILQLFL
jgi:RimJ/RimL family protein N-acetyltransferase